MSLVLLYNDLQNLLVPIVLYVTFFCYKCTYLFLKTKNMNHSVSFNAKLKNERSSNNLL